MTNTQLEKLRKEEADLLERYEQASARTGQARQALQEIEWRLSAEEGADRRDYEALGNFTETATLEEIGAVLLRRQAREILTKRIRYAVELAQSNFKGAEQFRNEAMKPLSQVRSEIQTIVERERLAAEEQIKIAHQRKLEQELATFRENFATST